MRFPSLFRSLPIMAALSLVVAACAPAAPASPTAAPAKPAAQAPAQPAEKSDAAAKPAGEKITLTGVTAWVKDFPFNDGYFEFERRLAENSGGMMTVQWRGGPEVAPPFEQAGVLKSGVFDLLNTTGSYYTNLVPEAPMFDLLDGPISAVRQAGIIEMFDRINQQRGGIKLLGTTSGSVAFGLFTKKPIQAVSDLQGLKIRSIPLYTPLIEAVGGSAVTMAPAEMYTALERGVVDGYGWPWAQIEDQKLYEVSKYIVEPGWFTVHEVLLMNLDTWNRLTPEQQKILTDTMIETENWADEYFTREYQAEMDRLINTHGMEVSRMPEAEARRYRELAYNGAWERFIQAAPENGQMIKEKAASYSQAWPPTDYQVFQPY